MSFGSNVNVTADGDSTAARVDDAMRVDQAALCDLEIPRVVKFDPETHINIFP